MQPVLILGGYGNFGKRIAAALVADGIGVVIAGRSREKARALVEQLAPGLASVAVFDAFAGLDQQLQALKPQVVINTCGPFQRSDYSIAQACIRCRVHYIDLADGRAFVTGITDLHTDAQAAGVSVISGASTVPGLSSAVLEHFAPEFSLIDEMRYGISPGQQAERGPATTRAILGTVGKPLAPFPSRSKTAYGWQDIHRQHYPGLGKRWMANCDIPDLDLFGPRYGIKVIRFSAGLELGILHIGLWGLSWLVRVGVPIGLARLGAPMLRASNAFNRFGSADGGMHVILSGVDRGGKPHRRSWFIVARNGDGPQIPTIPAVLLAGDLVRGRVVDTGAQPCVGMVSLRRYMDALGGFSVTQHFDR